MESLKISKFYPHIIISLVYPLLFILIGKNLIPTAYSFPISASLVIFKILGFTNYFAFYTIFTLSMIIFAFSVTQVFVFLKENEENQTNYYIRIIGFSITLISLSIILQLFLINYSASNPQWLYFRQ
jgi:hypothetical protein